MLVTAAGDCSRQRVWPPVDNVTGRHADGRPTLAATEARPRRQRGGGPARRPRQAAVLHRSTAPASRDGRAGSKAPGLRPAADAAGGPRRARSTGAEVADSRRRGDGGKREIRISS